MRAYVCYVTRAARTFLTKMTQSGDEVNCVCVCMTHDHWCLLLQDAQRRELLDMASKLLILPIPLALHQKAKALLASLFTSSQEYHAHKVPHYCCHI